MKHVKAPAIPATVVLVVSYGGEDYFSETKRGYSEDEAFSDILQGQIEDVQQVLKITADTCEDISAFIAARIIRRIDAGDNVALSAVEEIRLLDQRWRPACWAEKRMSSLEWENLRCYIEENYEPPECDYGPPERD